MQDARPPLTRSGRGEYLVPSSRDPNITYIVNVEGDVEGYPDGFCSCDGYLIGAACWHLPAARELERAHLQSEAVRVETDVYRACEWYAPVVNRDPGDEDGQ